MKDSHSGFTPPQGIPISALNHRGHRQNVTSTYAWQGTRIDALSSKKLWSILQQLPSNCGTGNHAAATAIKAELLARGDHASSTRWRAPH